MIQNTHINEQTILETLKQTTQNTKTNPTMKTKLVERIWIRKNKKTKHLTKLTYDLAHLKNLTLILIHQYHKKQANGSQQPQHYTHSSPTKQTPKQTKTKRK